MSHRVLFSFAVATVVAMAATLSAADKEKKSCASGCGHCCGSSTTSLSAPEKRCLTDAKCPVSDEKVSEDASIDYKGGKVYFCCSGCEAKFKMDQAKYAVKANQQLVITGQAKQIGCPLSGGKVNESTKIKVCGVEVGFCCKNCQGKVAKASPDKQCAMVFGKNFDKAFQVPKKESKEQENK